jgi:hypothetical protein
VVIHKTIHKLALTAAFVTTVMLLSPQISSADQLADLIDEATTVAHSSGRSPPLAWLQVIVEVAHDSGKQEQSRKTFEELLEVAKAIDKSDVRLATLAPEMSREVRDPPIAQLGVPLLQSTAEAVGHEPAATAPHVSCSLRKHLRALEVYVGSELASILDDGAVWGEASLKGAERRRNRAPAKLR